MNDFIFDSAVEPLSLASSNHADSLQSPGAQIRCNCAVCCYCQRSTERENIMMCVPVFPRTQNTKKIQEMIKNYI